MDRILCPFCDEPVEPSATGTYMEQAGWSKRRDAGGSNQVSLRKETGRYAHGKCVQSAVRGIDPKNQGVML